MRSEAEHNQLVSDLSLRVDELEEALAAERGRDKKETAVKTYNVYIEQREQAVVVSADKLVTERGDGGFPIAYVFNSGAETVAIFPASRVEMIVQMKDA